MAFDKENNKIILKRDNLPGVDLSVLDLTLLGSVKVRVSKVTKTMYKEHSLTFIGTRDMLNKGDVIQVGNLGLKYRVLKLSKVTDREGYIHRIKRVDNGSTTITDLSNVSVGQTIMIVNRKTFEQIFEEGSQL